MSVKDKHYTVSELAALVDVTHQWVAQRIWSGEIPAEKFGRDWLIRRDEVDVAALSASVNRRYQALRIAEKAKPQAA